MRRIVFFLLTNFAVMIVLGIVMAVLTELGILPRLGGSGEYVPLFIFSLLWGFGGSLISLFLSKGMAKRAVGARVIERPSNPTEAWLLETVGRQAQQAGIQMPEVAIYDAPEMNAFATGASKNKSLVAVSTGLLRQMQQDEVEAVLAHEVMHAANGDMVTMALLQGVLNAFVIFASRVLGGIVDSALRGSDRRGGHGFGYWIVVMVLEVVFGILATMIAMWFSRKREFRADAGAAQISGPDKMIRALQRLKGSSESTMPESVKAFGILGNVRSLLASHPPLEARIAALESIPKRFN
ncbi:MAG: protease HtpX [Myxococcota bacterium]